MVVKVIVVVLEPDSIECCLVPNAPTSLDWVEFENTLCFDALSLFPESLVGKADVAVTTAGRLILVASEEVLIDSHPSSSVVVLAA